jgi:hypothetical protein
MEIRRPVAALITALAVFGCGSLSGCGGPSSEGGFPEPPDPERVQQLHDNLPDLSDPLKSTSGQTESSDPG